MCHITYNRENSEETIFKIVFIKQLIQVSETVLEGVIFYSQITFIWKKLN